MKSVSDHMNEIQQELQDRMSWISSAVTLMNFATKHGMNEELKKAMEEHARKGEMQ